MGTPERVTFSVVFGVAEFRALWAAELCSIVGDQLARVALAVIVFARTDSAGWTAATYALTFMPAFLGAVFLGGLGDRYPRRAVMVVSDLARALLVGLMAVPGMPLAVLCVLVAGMTILGAPFKSAQQALLPQVFTRNPPGDRVTEQTTERERARNRARNNAVYETGQSIRATTSQAGQLVGFAGGGALVAVNPSVGLLLDAATFVLSAAVLRVGVRARPAAAPHRPAARLGPFMSSVRMVRRDPVLRGSFGLAWLAGVYIAPEALAAPYAAAVGAGSAAVGLLMAADPAGSVLGGLVWGRLVPEHLRDRLVGVLAMLAGVPLLFCVVKPGVTVSIVLFAVSGMAVTAVVIRSNARFTLRFPDEHRAQGSGLFSAGLLTAQGLGALGAGLLADWIGPGPALATAGAVGAVLAVPIARTWRRALSAHGQPELS